MIARRGLAVAAVVVGAAGLSACESSQDKSARLAKAGAHKAELQTVSAGAKNPDVEVLGTTVLTNKDGGKAVVVELEDTGAPQAAVPIQIDAKDAKGASVYKNNLEGLQVSLQQMAYLAKSQKTFWVHDQVVSVDAPKSVAVQVGKATAVPPGGTIPDIRLVGTKLATDSTGLVATGQVQNRSKIAQKNLPIYAVATKHGKVVAAGRAIIERLDPEPQKKPTIFRIYFIGNPEGAQLTVRAVPTTFTGAS